MNINFNTAYGDINIIDNDIDVNVFNDEEFIQNTIQALKTNEYDYALATTYGANLDSYIGESISVQLAENIKSVILENILKENTAVYAYDVNIPYIINKNTIEYRIIIDGLKSIQFSFIKDKGFKVQ